MRNFLRLLILGSIVLISCQLRAQTVYTFDWGSSLSPAWATAATSGTATNIGNSGVNLSINMVSTGGASTFVTNYPRVNGGGTDFVVAGSASSVMVVMNYAARTEYLRSSFVFSRKVSSLKFAIADLDKANATSVTYFDSVNVKGYFNGQIVYPSLKRFNASSNYTTILGNAAFANTTTNQGGNATSTTKDATAQQSTVLIDFGTAVLDSFTVDYGNPIFTQADPANEAIAIGNFTFQRVNNPPVANNFKNTGMPQGNAATAIPALIGSDPDGNLATYTITSVPTAAQGVLSVACPPNITGGTCTGGYTDLTPAVLSSNSNAIVLTPAQAASLRFDPTFNFAGNASFNFLVTDSLGLVSNTATYVLPVTAQPPVSNNIMENSMVNTLSNTSIQGLNSADPDGTIASYTILTIPSAASGVLRLSCANSTSLTCTGGYADVTAGTVIVAADLTKLYFDPQAGYVGNAVFTYNALDNSGNTSNTANYTIPVAATATTARPPLADNVTSQGLNNTLSNTSIPGLQATDLDGTITSYSIVTIPSAASGVLRISCPNSTALTCTGGYADITAGTTLVAADLTKLYFDPAATFTGTASFTYTATDNSTKVSNTATYNIPVNNAAPVSTNITATVPFNATITNIPQLFGTDQDGTIASYTITSVPTAAQGVLTTTCPPNITGAACTGGLTDLTPAVLTANSNLIVLTPAQAAALKFTPFTGFSGSAPFTYTSTDNNGNTSVAANYTISIAAQPPVTSDITNASIANNAATTAISNLTATDADGTIASYTLLTIPPTSLGQLSVPCSPPTPFTGATCTGGFQLITETMQANNYSSGFVLTPAQAAGLRFTPISTPATGNAAMVTFSFSATDNSGYTSNVSNYNIPITGAGNIPPVAKNITSSTLPNTAAATTITGLSATDADNAIASYTITSVPTAAQGVLSVSCPTAPPGATCTGGFADLTPAVLAANSNAIVLTVAQAASLRFDPTAGYTGQVNFTYTATDNGTGPGVSSPATYTIPVSGTAPVAYPVNAASMSHNASATTLSPTLNVTDADGTVASYSIESVPSTSQGVLSVACPPNLTGSTCTGGFQDLTATVLSNYPSGGIPLTPTQMATLRFTPTANYRGNVVFNYHGTDNSGLLSNSTTYTIPVSNLAPTSSNVQSPKILNSATNTSIPTLNSTDADGTIASYIITSVPPTTQGSIRIPCSANPPGGLCLLGYYTLTTAILNASPGGVVLTPAQAAGLQFNPVNTYNGDVVFNYAAFDNNGVVSNTALYVIQTGTSAALPLTLTNFAGARNGSDVVLKWETKNEVNVARFDVEYSTDGIHFTYAGAVDASNNPSGKYQFTVNNFTQEIGYFRLKMVDQDGKFSYTSTVIIRMNGRPGKAILVTPNPVSDNMQIRITSDVAAVATITIISGTGQVVYQANQQLYQGDNLLPMQTLLPKLTKGTYLVRAGINNDVLSTRFVYQR